MTAAVAGTRAGRLGPGATLCVLPEGPQTIPFVEATWKLPGAALPGQSRQSHGALMLGPDLDGIRVVVTGGASGIGHAITTGALAGGASVAVLDLDPARRAGPAPTPADVTDDESVAPAVHRGPPRNGGIDVLVNNAGIGAQGTVEANPTDEWRRVFDVNVLGMVRTTRAALPHLRRSTAAAVVNVCSIAATAGLPERALYSASKGAVLSLTLAMAADHLHEGIRVNCVTPGTTDTPWMGRLLARPRPGRRARRPERATAVRPAGQPEEVAATVVYLLSRGRNDHRHYRSPSTVAWPASGSDPADRHTRRRLLQARQPGLQQRRRRPDPLDLLQGTGSRIRHVTFNAPDDVAAPWVATYVRAAMAEAMTAEMGDGTTTVRESAGPKRRPDLR